MHPTENNALFSAWSEAERQAREAERRLYEQVLAQGGRPPSLEDVEQARTLRDKASELLAELLAGLRGEASQLRSARCEAEAANPASGFGALQ